MGKDDEDKGEDEDDENDSSVVSAWKGSGWEHLIQRWSHPPPCGEIKSSVNYSSVQLIARVIKPGTSSRLEQGFGHI